MGVKVNWKFIINPLRTRLDNYRVSILKSYEQINFWLQIVKNKKPVFYINQDFTEKKEKGS